MSERTLTPHSLGYFQPAEWMPHEACWLAWPSHADLWEENLPRAQAEFAALCEQIARSEKLNILVPDQPSQAAAQKSLGHLNPTFHLIPFGDIWLRDTAPIFLIHKDSQTAKAPRLAAARFKFNGWGQKYILPYDDQVSTAITATAESQKPLRSFSLDWILEGGSVEVDGEGTCLTSRQCLLNPNRNLNMNQLQIEQALSDALGVTKVLWVSDGLINDHTDGHIDTIARYVAPGIIACMTALDRDRDPNTKIYDQIESELNQFTDAKGRKIKVVKIPSPGKITSPEGKILPASYLNFYISNQVVIVPTYGSPYDEAAVKAIAAIFPERKTIGLSALAILTGGGAFHCITQQQPKVE